MLRSRHERTVSGSSGPFARGGWPRLSRWFGHGVPESTVVDIDVSWEGPRSLRVTSPHLVDWTLELDSPPMTTVMTAVGSRLPLPACRSPTMLRAMGAVASSTLGVGKVRPG